MKSFYSFFEQAETTAQQEPGRISDSLVTTFGRHNPPHLGHGKVFDKAHDLAQNEGADQRFYTSSSQDRKKNPLPRDSKIKFLKQMFPKHADKWDNDDNIKTFLQTAEKAHKNGYKNFHFVGGADRREDMENVLRKYNGNLYDFDNIYGHSAGEREGEDDIENMSASKLRNFAMNDDFEGFSGGMPKIKGFDPAELFREVQQYGMKNEEFSHEKLHQLYADGMLYKVGDVVESLTTSMRGRIHRCGANHLIVVTEDNIMFKSFIHDVQAI